MSKKKMLFCGSQNSFEFTVKTDNAGSSANNQFKLPLVNSGIVDFSVEWGDGSRDIITIWNQTEILHTYASVGTYAVVIRGLIRGFTFGSGIDRLKILNIAKVSALRISTNSSFVGCTNMTWTANDTPIIETNDLQNTFFNCLNFNGNISNWDVSGVTNMRQMFENAQVFNQNISNWNVSNVTNMYSMFSNARAFNQNISGWNVTNVIGMYAMFATAIAFNQNIGGWNVSNVTDFRIFMAGKSSLNFSASNLDAIYNGWSSRPVKPNIAISFGTIKYTAASIAGKSILTSSPNLWTIMDGGI